MNEDIVRKICDSYLNSTVHLCRNFHQKLNKLVGHLWVQIEFLMVPSHVVIQKWTYTVGALLKFLKSSNLLVYLSNGKIYANIPTNLRLSILLTIQTEKDILEPYIYSHNFKKQRIIWWCSAGKQRGHLLF